MTTYQLHQADREFVNEGCIWVRDENLRKEVENLRPVCLLRLLKRGKNSFGKSVCCEVLWADDDWIKQRHKHNISTPVPAGQSLVFISGWYRSRLGINALPGSSIDLDIKPAKSWPQAILWQLRACGSHPQIIVAMSTVLAVVGAGLGIMGVGAFLKDLLKDIGASDEVSRAVGFGAFLVGIVVFLLGWGPLLQRAQNKQ